jgi:hypothetical protein
MCGRLHPHSQGRRIAIMYAKIAIIVQIAILNFLWIPNTYIHGKFKTD